MFEMASCIYSRMMPFKYVNNRFDSSLEYLSRMLICLKERVVYLLHVMFRATRLADRKSWLWRSSRSWQRTVESCHPTERTRRMHTSAFISWLNSFSNTISLCRCCKVCLPCLRLTLPSQNISASILYGARNVLVHCIFNTVMYQSIALTTTHVFKQSLSRL